MPTIETIIRDPQLPEINEVERLESPWETSYIFIRDYDIWHNNNEVNYALQHIGDEDTLAIGIIRPGWGNAVFRGRVELSIDEAKLLQQFLNEQFPIE